MAGTKVNACVSYMHVVALEMASGIYVEASGFPVDQLHVSFHVYFGQEAGFPTSI